MTSLKRFVLILLSLAVFAFIAFYLFLVSRDPQNYEPVFANDETPSVALLQSVQTWPLTLGRQMSLGDYTVAPIDAHMTLSGVALDFEPIDEMLHMTLTIDPTLLPRNLDRGRYYLQFKDVTIMKASVNPGATLVPLVDWNGRTLMIEVDEEQVVTHGNKAEIVLETAVLPQSILSNTEPTATPSLDTIFIPANNDDS
ncbi:MAG: hypothetical protein AAF614_23185 [Chloroflexota bacterium]